MHRINTARVLLGGLLAGFVINVSESILHLAVIGRRMEAAMARFDLPPVGGSQIAAYWLLGFALGIGLVWLYAAIRPRYGAGVSTALCAGSAAYFFAYLYPSLGMAVMGMWPGRLIAISLVWGLVELMIAAVAGAWLYTETAPATAPPSYSR